MFFLIPVFFFVSAIQPVGDQVAVFVEGVADLLRDLTAIYFFCEIDLAAGIIIGPDLTL